MRNLNYRLCKDLMTGEEAPCVERLADIETGVTNAGIPFDEGNSDYQEYLAWVAEGNTAEPADE